MVLGTLFSLNQHLINVSAARNDSVVGAVPRNTSNDIQFIPTFELIVGAITYVVIILMTVIGNTMVVVAVFNYRPLKKVQNYFLVSLAASDLAVAVIVMPLHVVKFVANGRWLLGVTVCQLFTTADILLCTSSILNLCAIALDRYWAIHDPINYAQKRTPRFVCFTILLVWIVSGIISIPPMLGWNDWSSQELKDHCELSSEKAFVVFSASGSFFVPLAVMVVVYLKIFVSARQRIRTNRGRSALMRISQQPPSEKRNTYKLANGSSDSRKLIPEQAPLVDACSGITMGDVSSENKGSEESKGNHNETLHNLPIPKKIKLPIHMKRHSGPISPTEPAEEQLTTTVLRKREKISVAKEKRAAKTIAVIIFVFTFCWLPFFCAYVILPFCDTCYLHPKVHQAFVWLGYINSSLNPFLYGILNLEFRRAFRKILCPHQFVGSRRRSTLIRH
ncbi:unnamed protein product [Bursaphelenchus okinawaensis]|uniref:G-protein coupled receptors family 1 profile domain-containing protein n=1 Tax=Bursaphelenchus okinawaensis TaxID=465554 RepID=A0A811KLN9_9BILA|nr:unnamed protein product [Bursaphelenchus okinawaensis]CAG9104763.1 unnamed protein product [Bursaphelenchus okinawaensis]